VSCGVRPNIVGQFWSIDYVGPYAVLANGGFNAEFVAVELSCGYIVVFLVKLKKEASRCVKDLSLLCKRFGHRMEKLRVDFGTVERLAEFIQACSSLSSATKSILWKREWRFYHRLQSVSNRIQWSDIYNSTRT